MRRNFWAKLRVVVAVPLIMSLAFHYYDHGNDGHVDETIVGELDWVWTASSS